MIQNQKTADHPILDGDGDYSNDLLNNAWNIANDAPAAAEGFGVPSWYQLVSRTTTTATARIMDIKAPVFLWFNGNCTEVTAAGFLSQ